ncbi:GNAT family N-acetyltransferase [Sphingomonas glaciei]|uniref:GNAT family N-acetyltransferase n=1 Tax=Sphingomonas glaciei TaxID=2938948 RepID=A0ABY5MUS0_9SPHN|nr:GNAT family N-acetyltransferase [Sphingomonas glaciei]UUR08233.1 GNAT family N-acetyltransferase [Sphingomonas glaciei]
MTSTVVAKTDRLILRTWDDERWAEFVRFTNTPAVMRWLGGVFSPAQMAAARARLDAYQADHGFTFWAVERRSDDALLGFCGLKRANAPGAEPLHGEMEIGWRLREDAWGQGYAREAATASLDLAFDRFDAPRVIAFTALGNQPSQGLMLRLGMRHLPGHDYVDRRFPADAPPNPQVTFAIGREEWLAQPVRRR